MASTHKYCCGYCAKIDGKLCWRISPIKTFWPSALALEMWMSLQQRLSCPDTDSIWANEFLSPYFANKFVPLFVANACHTIIAGRNNYIFIVDKPRNVGAFREKCNDEIKKAHMFSVTHIWKSEKLRKRRGCGDIWEALPRKVQIGPEWKRRLTELPSDFWGALAWIDGAMNVAGDASPRFQFYSTMIHVAGGKGIPFRRTNPLPRRAGQHDRTNLRTCLLTIFTSRVQEDSTEIILNKISSQPLLSWRIAYDSKGHPQQSLFSVESCEHQIDDLIFRKDRNPSL